MAGRTRRRAMTPPSPTVARNSPCPCGSGRRYKDCHGALVPEAEPGGGRAGSGVGTAADLASAAAAHAAGDLDRAAFHYERACTSGPASFDAWHLLVVVRLQQRRLPDAQTAFGRTSGIRPGVDAPYRGTQGRLCLRRLAAISAWRVMRSRILHWPGDALKRSVRSIGADHALGSKAVSITWKPASATTSGNARS